MNELEKYQLNKNILCIDLKSFYASVECVLRGLDPFLTPLVVADSKRGEGSIVLAVSPYLKTKGIPSRCRIYELPKDINIIYAKPQMQTYLEYSTKVIETYLEFIDDKDLYIYSIDEAFLDVTNYLNYYQTTDENLALKILERIEEKLKIKATCGVGPNMLIAKLAMDIEAKKNENGLAKWHYKDLEEKLWPVTPLSNMWSIGHRMEKRLNLLGLTKIKDIALYPKEKLQKRFGILGLELWYHTHGIDMSLIQEKDKIRNKPKSFGSNQVLFKDYDETEILTILLEMIDDVTRRLRISKKRAKTVQLSIKYSKDYHHGFSRQTTLSQPTCNESIIYQACLDLFDAHYENYPIRAVGINLSNLTSDNTYQYSIFEDSEMLEKELMIQTTLDHMKHKYGKNAILRANSLEKHSTVKTRNKQIGGHHV